MNNDKFRVGIVVPSYRGEGDKWKSILTKFVSRLKLHMNNYDHYVFLFNFQGYSNDEQIYIEENIINEIRNINSNWKVLFSFRDPYEVVSMVRIREDAIQLNPDLDVYAYFDDDIFINEGSGEHYAEIINYFKEDPKLGMVMSAGFLGGYRYVGKLKYDVSKHWMTNRGLFFRNLHLDNGSAINHDELLNNHIGGYEDMLVAFEQLRVGNKLATYFNNPAYHKITPMEGKNDKSDYANKESRYEEDSIHNVDNSFESITTIMKCRYGIDYHITSRNDFKYLLTMINDKYQKGDYNA